MKYQGVVLMSALGVFLGTTSVEGRAVIDYDHLGANADRAFAVQANEGEFIEVRITRTSPSFLVTYHGMPKVTSTGRTGAADVLEGLAGLLAAAQADTVSQDTVVVTIPHRGQFGGYIVTLAAPGPKWVVALRPGSGPALLAEARKKDNRTRAEARQVLSAHGEATELQPVSLFIHVSDRRTWEIEFGGGFAVTTLVDDRYFAEEQPPGQPILRDAKDDAVRPLAVAFLHGVPPGVPWLAISLGLGVNDDKELALFPGLSWRMGGKLFATAGAHIGTVSGIPKGTGIDQPISDANQLTTPERRSAAGIFLSLTYSFLGRPRDTFDKPFALPPAKPPAGE